MSFIEIEKIFARRNDATSKHERDFLDLCIEWMRTLPLEAAPGALFQTPEGEATYLNSINLLIDLASNFEENKCTIRHICAQIDTIPLTLLPGYTHDLQIYQILREATQSWISVHVSYIMIIWRELKTTISLILAVEEPVYRKTLINLFDKYILSLAAVGSEKALGCHKPLTNLGRRKKSDTSGYIIQSIDDPDFSMRDFFLRGPISMFYGYKEPAQFEITNLCYCFKVMSLRRPESDLYYRNGGGRNRWMYGPECWNIVKNIHGLKREKAIAYRQFKKLYPNEHLNLVRVLIRLT